MDKGKLAALSREALILRAEELGVRRASFLTRPELVDAILLSEARLEGERRGVTRGFVGLARDLLARLVERGLHLPDAAERIRGAAQPPRARPQGESIPTVTLAEIYARQGHVKRALSTLQKVLELDPEHAEALALQEQLQPQKTPAVKPKNKAPRGLAKSSDLEPSASQADGELAAAPQDDASPSAVAVGLPEAEAAERTEALGSTAADAEAAPGAAEVLAEDEPLDDPISMLDDGPLPPRYDVDECVALPVDPRTVFVYWELRESTLRRVVERAGDGLIVLRVALYQPSWHGPVHQRFDCEVHARLGEYFVRDLPEGAVVRVAIGYRTADGRFLALGHSALFEPALPVAREAEPPREPVRATALLEWRPDGAVPVQRSGREAAFLAEALYASQAPELRQLAQHYGEVAILGARAPLQEIAASWAHAVQRGGPGAPGGSSEQRPE